MSKKTKDNARKCSLHGEPFAMFCTTKKAMLCMKCFRDTSAEARRYCVDLDTAYNQGAKKLERALTVPNYLIKYLIRYLIIFIVVDTRAPELAPGWGDPVQGIAGGTEEKHGVGEGGH